MMTPYDLPEGETELQLIDGVLADLGSINRRATSATLSEDDFAGLMRRARERLKRLRAARLAEDEPAIELTDAGAAAIAAFEAARQPAFRDLVRRGELTTGRALMERCGVRRARVYGDLVAIGGDRA